VIVGASVAVGAWRVAALEARELEVAPDAVAIEGLDREESVELARAHVDAGERALFEVCSDAPLDPDAWRDTVELVAWIPSTSFLLVRVPLDARALASASRSADGTCIVLGEAPVPRGGDYAITVVRGTRPLDVALAGTELTGRIVVTRALGPVELGAVLALFVGALLLLGTLAATAVPASSVSVQRDAGSVARLVGGLGIVLGAGLVLSRLPLWGSTLGLVRGLALVPVELAVVWALVVRPRDGSVTRSAALGLVRPTRAAWAVLLAAPLVGGLLAVVAQVAVALVPSSGVSPIQAMVAFPSGTLSFAIVALVVPLVEEVYFRGFVFGAVERLGGRWVACLATTVLFVAAHAPQAWGAWGGLVAIAATGTVLAVLRATTRTVLVGAIAHLLYNAALTALQLSGS